MKPRDKAVKTLEQSGYYLKRIGANHDIFYSEQAKSIIPLKRHDFDEDDLRYIKRKSNTTREDRAEKPWSIS